MKDTGKTTRAQRGIALADAGAATRRGDLWIVRGSTRNFTVDLDRGTCACPDYQQRMKDEGGQCKHIVAAQITDSRDRCRRKARRRIIRHEADGLRGISQQIGRDQTQANLDRMRG